jgi:hypothetical protein
MPCTSAGILPPISTSNPGWNQQIYYLFQQFEEPVVYTPGDNEWSDCHKSKQLSAGAPMKELATFRRPVLLLNGDTHLYFTDHPLADPSSATGVIHHTQAVPNLTRIVVQGSTNTPAEWLRLIIDPRKPQVFSWQNVVYCANPGSSPVTSTLAGSAPIGALPARFLHKGHEPPSPGATEGQRWRQPPICLILSPQQ